MQPDTFDLFSDLSGSLYAVTSECHGNTVQRAVRLLRSPCTDMHESLTGGHGVSAAHCSPFVEIIGGPIEYDVYIDGRWTCVVEPAEGED